MYPRGLGQNGDHFPGVDLTLIYNVEPEPGTTAPVPGVVGPSIFYGGTGPVSPTVRTVRPVTSRTSSASGSSGGSAWMALAFLIGLAGVVGGSRKR